MKNRNVKWNCGGNFYPCNSMVIQWWFLVAIYPLSHWPLRTSMVIFTGHAIGVFFLGVKTNSKLGYDRNGGSFWFETFLKLANFCLFGIVYMLFRSGSVRFHCWKTQPPILHHPMFRGFDHFPPPIFMVLRRLNWCGANDWIFPKKSVVRYYHSFCLVKKTIFRISEPGFTQ